MVIVRLRTKKGVRTTTISDTNIYKYTKSRAGIYSKKDKVKKNNKISYEKLSNKEKNTKYIYDPEQKSYIKYNKNKLTRVQTESGSQLVSHEQLRYLYKKEGDKYTRTKTLSYKDESHKSSYFKERIPSGYQMIVDYKFIIKGKSYQARGYSKLQRGRYSKDETKNQTQQSAIKSLHQQYNISYSLEGLEDIKILKVVYRKWIT